MNWNDFFKSLKAKEPEGVYLFIGPEELTKREALEALRRAVLPAGLEQLNDITLESVRAQDIIDAAETMPVMCERRIVTVKNWPPLLSAKNKADEAELKRMMEWLGNPPESCILVFFMTSEPDWSKKLPKSFRALCSDVVFELLSGAALQKWCAQQLKSSGKHISAEAVNELTLMAGQELTRLSGELKKLSAYIGERSEIQVEDVQEIVSPSPEYSVFMILDRLLEGRLAEATEIVNSVLQSEPSVVRLIALLTSQLRIDTHMKYASEGRSPMQEVQKALNVSDGRARHIQRQIRRISAEGLKRRYLDCIEADHAIKTGQLKDRAALDLLMLKCAEKD